MAKQLKLQILNIALFLLLMAQLLTGIRLWFVELLEWEDSETVMSLHLIVGFCLVLLILAHIYLNRWWVKVQFGLK
jgi:cytochrome b subunit of formate dehydrogenase